MLFVCVPEEVLVLLPARLEASPSRLSQRLICKVLKEDIIVGGRTEPLTTSRARGWPWSDTPMELGRQANERPNAAALILCSEVTSAHACASLALPTRSPPSLVLPNSATGRKHKDTFGALRSFFLLSMHMQFTSTAYKYLCFFLNKHNRLPVFAV